MTVFSSPVRLYGYTVAASLSKVGIGDCAMAAPLRTRLMASVIVSSFFIFHSFII